MIANAVIASRRWLEVADTKGRHSIGMEEGEVVEPLVVDQEVVQGVDVDLEVGVGMEVGLEGQLV